MEASQKICALPIGRDLRGQPVKVRSIAKSPDHKEDLNTTRLRQLLPTAWDMIRPYWSSEDRWAAWGLLIVVIALTLGMVYISVLFNQWNNTFYTALQDRNHTVFLQQLIRLPGSWVLQSSSPFISFISTRCSRFAGGAGLPNDIFALGWPTVPTIGCSSWRVKPTIPDQRIAEDVHLLISHTLTLLIGGLRALVTLIAFVAILWALSGTFTVPLGGSSLTLPGYMVWAAILYAIGGTWLTHWIGRPLVRLNYDKQRCEADFRFGLVRFRENTEGVALYRGEADELRGFRGRFEAVVMNWWDIMRRQKRLTYFTSGYQQAAWIFPSIVAAPRYFRANFPSEGSYRPSALSARYRLRLVFLSTRIRRSLNGARWLSGSPVSSALLSACAFRRRPAAAFSTSAETRASDN